jgi:hypothetical protein
MNKRELALLERGFIADIEGALNKTPRMFQTRSKLAEKLADEGFLQRVEYRISGVVCKGYSLTLAGNFAYCMSLDDSEPSAEAPAQSAPQTHPPESTQPKEAMP